MNSVASPAYQHHEEQAQKSILSKQPAANQQQRHRPIVYIFAMVAALIRHLGNSLTYWLYALLAIAAIGFCWLLVPETKGKSLEQIEHYWKKGRHWSFKTSSDDEVGVHSLHVDNSGENNNRMHDGRQMRSR